jgi:hypothetical protein
MRLCYNYTSHSRSAGAASALLGASASGLDVDVDGSGGAARAAVLPAVLLSRGTMLQRADMTAISDVRLALGAAD